MSLEKYPESMNEKQLSDQNKGSCNCCCKLKLIFMSVVAISLSLIALCAVVKTFARCDRDGYRGKWKQECGEWGRGERMGGCRMKKNGYDELPHVKGHGG